MKRYRRSCLLLIVAFAALHLVQAEDQTGFISLDCGLVPKDNTYTEKKTDISYISDANFITTGKTEKIQEVYQTDFEQHMWSIRSFPDGTRNCYNLNVTTNTKYLIRASFMYGNYDNQTTLPTFDLYIGPNVWTSVEIRGIVNVSLFEIIHVATSNRLQVCLVKTGPTTPFISALELRPLSNSSYNTQIGSLVLFSRAYFSKSDKVIRFEEDIHDRIWVPYFQADWSLISTNHNINIHNPYEPPELAMMTAATPKNSSEPLHLTWTLEDTTARSYIYMHFAEINSLGANETREFNITYNNGNPWYSNFSPPYFNVTTIFNPTAVSSPGGSFTAAVSSPDGSFDFTFVKTQNSTLPPLINALEIYTVLDLSYLETEQDEVDAMMKIKKTYNLGSKLSWEGDPCSPPEYRWEGVNCSYPDSEAPRITSLNLSANSLVGDITPYISNLTHLKELDLSNNDLTGEFPPFLADMKSLTLLNLRGNKNLNGSVPQSLLQKQQSNSLTLNVDGTLICPQNCKKNGKKFPVVAVAAPVASLALVVAILAIFFVIRRKRQRLRDDVPPPSAPTKVDTRTSNPSDLSIMTKNRRFTYSEVLSMTNNFERFLGRGSFGIVYHGHLDETEVAVKLLSNSSAQVYKQFRAEVELLLKVHHKNLVSLVGYCSDGDKLALIYEYMANGDLKEHLLGKRKGNALTWARRMSIIIEAAQGLEYLHNGCKPPMVHRDVKTTNILLNEHFEAKLGDFGLSRTFSVEDESHVSTVIAGTPGYLDPEYYATNWLSEKSDAYSFGVTLLEIITNQPVIDKTREKHHISEWVLFMLSRGDIRSIVDPRLNEDYDVNGVWKAVELALACVNPTASKRPSMPHVMMELNECVSLEVSRTRGCSDTYSKDSVNMSLSLESGFVPRAR